MLASILGPTGREAAQPTPMKAQPVDSYYGDGAEPPLGEVIADPVVRSLMDSDGVGVENLMAIIADAQAKLGGR